MLKTSRLKPENPMEEAADMSGHFVTEERAWGSHKTTEQIRHKDVVMSPGVHMKATIKHPLLG